MPARDLGKLTWPWRRRSDRATADCFTRAVAQIDRGSNVLGLCSRKL